MTAFSGFPKETFDFLYALTNNNSKIWFDQHRDDYQAYYMAPAKLFVEAIGKRLQSMEPHISAVPQVNKSIFRINRDIRFSKDKTPYKNHIDLWFYEGAERRGGSGFFSDYYSTALFWGRAFINSIQTVWRSSGRRLPTNHLQQKFLGYWRI